MKINLDKKAQVRLIVILATIVLLSTFILAAVAFNESNQTNETGKNISDLNVSGAEDSLIIEIIPPLGNNPTQEAYGEKAIAAPGSNSTDNSIYADQPEAWWVTCADNTEIVWDENRQVTIPTDNDEEIIIIGAYKPSLHTYEAFPECTTNNAEDYVDVKCLLERCSELIEYNVITGETRTIWRNGEFW